MNMAKTKAPVQKNQSIELIFTDITHEGNGVGKVEGYPIFVPLVLPGETASVKVVKVNKKFAFGKLLHIKEASPERETPPCADRKSTRLNSSHVSISYAVFCVT